MTTVRRQRGVALIIALFALLLMSSLGIALLFMADSETSINNNYRSTQRAYFAAVGGAEELRMRLTTGVPAFITPPPVVPSLADNRGVVYVRNAAVVNGALEVVDPVNPGNPYFDTELCHANYVGLALGNPGVGVPCPPVAPAGNNWYTYVDSIAPFSQTAAALPFKWARVSMKVNASADPHFIDGSNGTNPATYSTPICWDGFNELLLPAGYARCDQPPMGGLYYKPVYVLTAFARGSRRMVQMEVAEAPPMVTNAAVDSLDRVILNGQLDVNGYDYCSCDCIVDKRTGITTCKSRPGKVCDTSKWAIYSAKTVDRPIASETIVAGQDPPIAQNQDWPYDITKLVVRYRDLAQTVDVRDAPYNWICSGIPLNCGTRSSQEFGVPPNLPPNPPDNPQGPQNMRRQVTYVPGNLALTAGARGNGVLVVDGDLNINGGFEFYGLILVKGVVRFSGGGNDKVNIYGGILAGQQALDDTMLGGSANIYYDLCSLLNDTDPEPPTQLGFRELMY